MAPLRLVTRKSELALWQANFVATSLMQSDPSLSVTLMKVTTEGDRLLGRVATHGGKGLFVKALEEAILEGRADFAVHSLKDVPMELPPGLTLAAYLPAESPYDVLVSPDHLDWRGLPQGACVGTASFRRGAQLLSLRPDLAVKAVHGNVLTRLSKLDAGNYDALILAEAGLIRLGLAHRITHRFSSAEMVPAVGQGVIAVECRSEDSDLIKRLALLNDPTVSVRVRAERSANAALGGSCSAAIGCFANVLNKKITLTVRVLSQDGLCVLEESAQGNEEAPELLGQVVAEKLIKKGAQEFL